MNNAAKGLGWGRTLELFTVHGRRSRVTYRAAVGSGSPKL